MEPKVRYFKEGNETSFFDTETGEVLCSVVNTGKTPVRLVIDYRTLFDLTKILGKKSVLLLEALAQNIHHENIVESSIKSIASEIGLSSDAYRRSRAELLDKRLIKVSGKETKVNPQVAWKGERWMKDKRYHQWMSSYLNGSPLLADSVIEESQASLEKSV